MEKILNQNVPIKIFEENYTVGEVISMVVFVVVLVAWTIYRLAVG